MRKLKMVILLFLLIILFIVFCYFFIGSAPKKEKIAWGVVFSQKHSKDLGLDWQKNYLELLDDLKVRDLRILTHWDLIEKEPQSYNFEDLDFQINEGQKRGAKILLVVGLKTGRWPECHIPDWAENLSEERIREKVLELTKEIVLRYKDSPAVWAWQVENEPFFIFGVCPKINMEFIKKEIELVKELDPQKRPVVVSDSGEGSFWIKISRLSDIGGTTMYRKVWARFFNFYFDYKWVLPPVFYWRKAKIIEKVFGKEMICTELQAEPWGKKLLYDSPPQEQRKTMDLEQFKRNIEFAKKTGFGRFYLWGGEWWYWQKEVLGDSRIWEEAKKIFQNN